MSDRKKRYVSYKEANKRPPVILSKHSDYNHDAEVKSKDINRREKSNSATEKDSASQSSKQPTILIKTRDDPQRSCSPKRVQNKENDSGNTQKTVVVSSTASENSNLSTTKMKQPVKLIDNHLEFNLQALDYFCDNQNDYLVVGIIGTQGVGKSTILNLIAHSNTSNLTARILNNQNKTSDSFLSKTDNAVDSKSSSDIYSEHSSSDILSNSELGSDRTSSDSNVSQIANEVLAKKISEVSLNKYPSRNETEKKTSEFIKFDVESEEQLQLGQHCTNGIDMYITTNRMILLDTQPLLSASVMDKMISSDNKSMATETAVELESLYITSFILSTCHIVILVQDWFMDPNVPRFLLTADMLKPSIPTTVPPVNEESSHENSPHVLLLHNKATMTDFTSVKLEYMTQVYESIFHESKMRVRSGLCAECGKNRSRENKKAMMDSINLFLLPEVLPDYANEEIYKGHESLEQLVRVLRQRILGANRLPMGLSVISEKHWGHFAAKTWEGLKKSSFFVEYTRMLS